MTKGTMILGVIPARGGSKGVPGKNIRSVQGKPLIAYAIECGLSCPSIDHVIVSTDSPEIAAIALQNGAQVPFMRPAELAQDTTPMLPVLENVIKAAEEYYSHEVECVVLMDPTGPLRVVEDIEDSIRIFRSDDCDAVISGSPAHRSPYFNMVKEENGYAKLLLEPSTGPVYRRQDAPPVYDLNTVVWVFSRKAIMVDKARIPQRTKLKLIPTDRSIDLDTEADFTYLEHLLKKKQGNL